MATNKCWQLSLKTMYWNFQPGLLWKMNHNHGNSKYTRPRQFQRWLIQNLSTGIKDISRSAITNHILQYQPIKIWQLFYLPILQTLVQFSINLFFKNWFLDIKCLYKNTAMSGTTVWVLGTCALFTAEVGCRHY